jgi:Flp pilus assembly protein TadG
MRPSVVFSRVGAIPSRVGRRARRFLRRFARDRRGLSAVEFALVAPMMLTLLFGSVEGSNLLVADRKVTSVASTTADLTAQARTLERSDLDDIFAAARALLVPYNTTRVRIVVSSVVLDGNGRPEIAWSEGYNTGAHAEGSSFSLPDGLIASALSSVIVAEVSYTYESGVGLFYKDGITLRDTFYVRPRRTTQIDYLG